MTIQSLTQHKEQCKLTCSSGYPWCTTHNRYWDECQKQKKLLSNPNHILCELTRDDFKLAKELWGNDLWSFGWNTDGGEHDYRYGWFAPRVKFHAFHSNLIMGMEAWQYHLQQLIISPDPVAYIRENTT